MMKHYAQIYLQLSNLQYDEIPLKPCEKRAKKKVFRRGFVEKGFLSRVR